MTLVDDVAFGSLIVGLDWRTARSDWWPRVPRSSPSSVAMAATTAWALRVEPLRLSDRARRRIADLSSGVSVATSCPTRNVP